MENEEVLADVAAEIQLSRGHVFTSVVPNGEVSFAPEDEFVIAPEEFFCPNMVNWCLLRGIFPMAVSHQKKIYFALKLHTHRCVCLLDPSVIRAPFFSGENIGELSCFNGRDIHVKKNLLTKPNDKTKCAALSCFINRENDLCDAFELICAQHGEMWLCRSLRICLYHMFLNPNDYEAKVILTAVRRFSYGGPGAQLPPDEVEEGELVACEIGFLVGDIYTSATGAFCVNGAGLLQLALTAKLMETAGCKVWDLGMGMEYKHAHLKPVEIERNRWVNLVKERKKCEVNILNKLANYKSGITVSDVLSDLK